MATKTCVSCGSEMSLGKVERASGTDHGLTVTLHEMPVMVCPNGHRQFVRDDFALLLLDHLIEQDEPRLPAGERTGLIFHHFKCASCGGELAPKPDHRETFPIDIALQGVAPFRLELASEVYACRGCGKEQLHSLKEVRNHTPAALAHAFRDGQIAHG